MRESQEKLQRIVDLHTHVFNARHLPLESIIRNALGNWSSLLAVGIAKLLYELTGSAGEEAEFARLKAEHANALIAHESAGELDYIDSICNITEHQVRRGATQEGVLHDDLVAALRELDGIDYALEGWSGDPDPDESEGIEPLAPDAMPAWARRVVKRALRRMTDLIRPNENSIIDNYAEFFFTLLASEDVILKRLRDAYGETPAPMEFVHYMMDMELAYPGRRPPRYKLDERRARMQELALKNRDLKGFFAFDPRHKDCVGLAEDALEKGFLGFKFYPAMGYRPHADEHYSDRIEAFYDLCLKEDAPIFAHCTPVGFESSHLSGRLADPVHWLEVLKERRTLRLCLGHAGGMSAPKRNPISAGWAASSEVEWAKGNYAWQVVDLCVQYPNVYCEVGHLEDLLKDDGMKRFEQNLRRACEAGGDFGFMDKIAYGSDWHMQAMVNSARPYLGLFLKLFENEPWCGYKERFFWRNAYAYLRLPR